jgi:hypothetical protein
VRWPTNAFLGDELAMPTMMRALPFLFALLLATACDSGYAAPEQNPQVRPAPTYDVTKADPVKADPSV